MIKYSRSFLRWTHSLRQLFYHGKPEEVIQQYRNRSSSSSFSVQDYCILFKACTATKDWSTGYQVHTQIKTDAKLYQDQRLKIVSR
jgi:hypothetical protein